MDEIITIYILTHKQFNYQPIDTMYKPLLNGSALQNTDFGYLRDDIGDNISELNPFYAELTGQYWVWKNSKSDIIGFCHYRRFFVKNILLNKLEEKDIQNILNDYDIILPNISHMGMTHIEDIKKSYKYNHIGPKIEEYCKLRKILEKDYPEYLIYFDELLNEKKGYGFNMFICRKKIADDYFKWLFDILKKLEYEINFYEYPEGQKRVLGYLSERLLHVYVKKNELKIKEKPILQTDRKLPWIYIFAYKSHIITWLFKEYIIIRERLTK